MILKEKIEDALRSVIDPGTNLDIMRMRLVRNLLMSGLLIRRDLFV